MKRTLIVLFAVVATLLATVVQADTYPSKPIKLIVPYPAGGGNDIVARIVGQKLGENLGTPVIIENKPGGGTLIGAQAAAAAAPDGYTLFDATIATMSINPSLYKQLPYNPVKDFAPIIHVVNFPLVLLTAPSNAAHSVADMLAMAKAQPGQLSYASAGNGSSHQLGMEHLKSVTQTDMLHVAYKGSAPALPDLMSGQVTFMFCEMPPAVGLIKSGKVRALAMSTNHRSSLMPDLPTVSDTVPGFGFTSWLGFVAPAGTPPAIVKRLQKELDAILATPEMKTRLSELGAEPVGGTSEQFAELIKSETTRWAQVVKTSGAKIE